jgi:hypothetical protein
MNRRDGGAVRKPEGMLCTKRVVQSIPFLVDRVNIAHRIDGLSMFANFKMDMWTC